MIIPASKGEFLLQKQIMNDRPPLHTCTCSVVSAHPWTGEGMAHKVNTAKETIIIIIMAMIV